MNETQTNLWRQTACNLCYVNCAIEVSRSFPRDDYFASSVARVSRMTVTRICPG
jgi:hypothetical protein